jgi:integrase/recombinase XerC
MPIAAHPMQQTSALVRGRHARAELPTPTLTIAGGREHTAESILRAWRESKSENTIKAYESDLQELSVFISRAMGITPPLTVEATLTHLFKQAAPVAHETMLFYRGHLQKCGMAPATVNRHLAAVRSVAKLARQLGLTAWTLEVPGLKNEKRRDTRGPTLDDVRRMLDAIEGDDEAATRDRAIIVTFTVCGLRVSELVGLRWEDTDLSRGSTWILGKGRKERELIALPAAVIDAIRCYQKHRGTAAGPLFRTRGHRGKHRSGELETRSVARIIRKAGARVGLRCWPHALRHTSITTAADAAAKSGISLERVRSHSRHANISTLVGYIDSHDKDATKRTIADLVSQSLQTR